jgi:type III secretory pathway component EscU
MRIMVNKALLIVLIIGLGIVISLAGFSYSATAMAQQMQMPGMTMQQQQAQSHQNAMMKHSMFKVDGMSMAENVKISGVSITGEKEVSVTLAYNGNTTSPASL